MLHLSSFQLGTVYICSAEQAFWGENSVSHSHVLPCLIFGSAPKVTTFGRLVPSFGMRLGESLHPHGRDRHVPSPKLEPNSESLAKVSWLRNL